MLKRIFNLVVSVFVRTVDWLLEGLGRAVGMTPPARCMVLAYHSVSAKERVQFARQMDVVRQRAEVVSADIQTLPGAGKRYAAITFDDGLENILENALPELSQRGMPSTLFIVTEGLGSNRSWEHLGGDDTRDQKVMSEEQLKRLPSDLVLIGSHTMTHPLLPTIEKERLRQELLGSRTRLEAMLHRPVKLFSFPYGGFDDASIEGSRAAGYERVFTALPVFAFCGSGEFVTGRVGVSPLEWPIEFRLKLAGAYRWLPYAFALKRRVKAAIRGGGRDPQAISAGEKRAA